MSLFPSANDFKAGPGVEKKVEMSLYKVMIRNIIVLQLLPGRIIADSMKKK